jgi:alkylhydroperoxidase family enzyme
MTLTILAWRRWPPRPSPERAGLGSAAWLVFTAAFLAAHAVRAPAAVAGAGVIAPARRGAPGA